MSQKEEALFKKFFPHTQFNDVEAAASVQNHGLGVSVYGRRGIPDNFVLCVATTKDRLGPITMNRKTAVELKRLLTQEGF